jgi:hypothetical protein
MPRRSSKQAGWPVIHERAAGIDIGSRFHVVAVPPDPFDEPVQSFQPSPATLSAWPTGW